MTSNNKERVDREDLTLHNERCFLVGLLKPGRYDASEEPLSELTALLETAGAEIVGSITQKLDKATNRYYLGKGKFYDLVDQAHECGADTIVVDDDITPTQLSTIEEAARLKVIDRSEVILDIFLTRATSKQAILQVELAQLEYELPRLARKWTHLERLGGGIGTRGPGESQIETDRRIIRRKLSFLRKDLQEIGSRKEREVAGRDSIFTTCLVGYTNAGKSSMLKHLTGDDVYVEDQLFATLDTLTRQLTLPNGSNILVSDTVGFIRRLPHHLVASFHATLEEASQADLLLLVVDGSDSMARTQVAAVEETLESLGMGKKERLYLINKADKLSDEHELAALRAELGESVVVSAHTGQGVATMLEMIEERVLAGKCSLKLKFSAGDGKRLALINQVGVVSDTSYDGGDVIISVVLERADYERIKRLPGEMLEV